MELTQNVTFVDNYFNLLNSLNREDKVKIIEKLSLSISEKSEKKDDVVERFFGAFQSNQSAEEIISNIRINRNFIRSVVSF